MARRRFGAIRQTPPLSQVLATPGVRVIVVCEMLLVAFGLVVR